MSRYKHDDHREDESTAAEVAPSPDGRGECCKIPPDDGTSPRLQVPAIERTAIVRLQDAEIPFQEAAARPASNSMG